MNGRRTGAVSGRWPEGSTLTGAADADAAGDGIVALLGGVPALDASGLVGIEGTRIRHRLAGRGGVRRLGRRGGAAAGAGLADRLGKGRAGAQDKGRGKREDRRSAHVNLPTWHASACMKSTHPRGGSSRCSTALPPDAISVMA